MQTSYTPTSARSNLYKLLKQTNADHVPIMINSTKEDSDGVLLSRRDWNALQETLYLEQTGTGALVRKREKDHSGSTDIDDIDWDEL